MRGKYPILLTYLIDHLGLAIVFPIFTPLVLNGHFAHSHFIPKSYVLALVIIAFPIAQFFGAPLIGSLSDRIGRKKALIATVLGTAAGYSIISFGAEWDSLSVLVLGRAWTGFFAGNLTLCLSALYDMSHDDKTKTDNFSLLATAGGLSFIIAVLIAESLFSAAPSFPFWFTSGLSLVNFVLIVFFFKETLPIQKDKPHLLHGFQHMLFVFKIKELRKIYLVYFFFVLSWIPTLQFLPINISKTFGTPSDFQKTAFIGLGIIWSLVNLIFNPFLHRKFTTHKILSCALPLLSLVLLTTHFLGELTSFLVVFGLAVVAGALTWTNTLILLSNAAPQDIHGKILGMNQSVGATATLIGLAIAGFLSLHDPHYVFLYTACTPLIGWAVLKTIEHH
jgi:DHA1 family tetracycline resistance protein-like MFS transporter